MKQLTEQEVTDYIQSFTIKVRDTPFKKLCYKDGFFYVYDEFGKIRKATTHVRQAVEVYNSI